MKKTDAEPQLRRLCHVWKAECHPNTLEQDLQFADFARWVKDRHPDLLAFRSTMGPMEDAERWFDQEFHQTWRN